MKHKFLIAAFAALGLLSAAPASAGGDHLGQGLKAPSATAIGNAEANAGAQATIGNVSSGASAGVDFKPTLNLGASAGIGDVELQTGDAAANLNLQQQFNSYGSKIPLQAAPMPGVAPATPALFIHNGATMTAPITGAAFQRWVQSVCKQRYTKTSSGSTQKVKGASGLTIVQGTLYPDYNNKRFATDTTWPEVSLELPGPKTEAVCVGVITVQAKSGEGSVDVGVLNNDAVHYALELQGYGEVWLISPESAIGGGLGVETDGKGFGIGGSGVGLAGAVTTALGLSGGVSSGATNPVARMGTTYAIFAKPTRGSSTVVDPDDYSRYHAKLYPQAPAKVEDAAKKDAATK